MTRDEVLDWFLNVGRKSIEDNHGLFCTYYRVYESIWDDPYSFTIGFTPYSCGLDCTCDECPYRTIYGDCGENNLYINEDGTITYDGETYTEDRFDEFLNQFI